jgi:Do/DeqQ family serine protease
MDKRGLLLVLMILSGGIWLSRNYKCPLSPDKTSESEESLQIPPALDDLQDGFTSVVDKIRPSLVNISAVHIIEVKTPFYNFYFGNPFEEFFNDFFGQDPRKRRGDSDTEKFRYEGTGSGAIVDPGGYILTNYHVIKDADEIKVTTYDDKQYDAKVIGKDPKTDLAVVRIKSMRKFDALKMGDSENLRAGEWVIAAGSPFGLNQTYTAGIISALRQDVSIENINYRDMIQTDASINRGNSGGPLVNLRGEAIGINTAIYAPTGVFSGVGFAIPINLAKKILEELMEKGRVVRSWLGVEIYDVDHAIMKNFGLDKPSGVLVNRVIENSSAQAGGLMRGDIICSIDGKAVKNSRELQERVSSSKPGTNVKMTVVREGKKLDLTFKLQEMPDTIPEDEGSGLDTPEGGYSWRGILFQPADYGEWNSYPLVSRIDPSSAGYEIGLQTGDIIRNINRQDVNNLDALRSVLDSVDLKNGVVFDLIREGKPMFLSYKE